MILSPAEYYRAAPKLGRFMREVSGPFAAGVSRGQLRRIAKCEAHGYLFQRSDLETCYPIIAENRRRKGREYGITEPELRRLERMGEILYFSLHPPVAAAICALVEPTTLYVSAWGDVERMGHLSPVTLLCKRIYEWCSENGISLLDIGIATDDGVPDEKLIAFKRSLGFQCRT